MRGVELPRPIALGPKVFQVFAGLVVLENDVAGVAIGQIDVAVGIDRDGCRAETGEFESRLLGEGQLERDRSIGGVELDTLLVGVACAVDELCTLLVENLDVMPRAFLKVALIVDMI